MNKKLIENLEKNGFKVEAFSTAKEAADYLDKAIDSTSVGFGGSVTADQMGLVEMLATHNEVWAHKIIPEGMTAADVRMKARNASVYISSANAVSETGEIVNIDGTGNRVSEISFGHDVVYIVAGKNKVAADLDSAIFRARNVAAPLNAKRLNRKTPCAANADKCYDCNSPERICRNISILVKKPTCAEYVVVLVDEELGY